MTADQYACTEAVLETEPEAAIVANLGVASWVLAEIDDRDRNYYMRGAMGCTTPVGLGLALAIDEPVVVLDGDGSLLMSLGCLSTVGNCAPSNLTIVVWVNRSFATTGGQPTAGVDFAAAAEACGVAGVTVESLEEFHTALDDASSSDGPSLIACTVETVDTEGPATYDYAHEYLEHRFRTALQP
jgi:thiamine pyrophosphate-dependent acetolactate synthase large subunit-like protein